MRTFLFNMLATGLARGLLAVGLLATSLLMSCHTPSDPDKPHVVIKTRAGDIEVELYPRQAPRTVGAFLSYVDSGTTRAAIFTGC